VLGKNVIVSVISLFASAGPVMAAPIVIDGLTQGPLNVSASGAFAQNGANQSSVDAVGGNRAVSISHLFDPGTSSVSLATGGPLTVTGADDYLSLGYGYTYVGGGFNGNQEINLDLSGASALEFDFGSINSGNVGLIINLTTDKGGGNYGYLTNNNPGDHSFFTSSAGALIVPFSQLENDGIDLSKINLMEFSLQSSDSFTLSSITAIPEPATLLLLPGALLAMVHRRRSKASGLMS